ncbi:MAG: RagB/SusD family nutrient uptake outer membrane protein [Bacteroidota bacterium]|nr:RagB/SusD family nutrient uptake outer membrane protein [Bacteroidota bacterium]
MNRLITLFISTATLILILFNGGCSEDFLAKPAGGDVTVDTIFGTKNQAQYAVSQMYNTCIYSYFPYGAGELRPDALTDELYFLYGVQDNWSGGPNIQLHTYVSGNMSTEKPCDWAYRQDGSSGSTPAFGIHYKGIRQANLVIENIRKVVDADATWKNDVIAQALFCRAMQHFELFRYYGGIPIVNHTLGGSDVNRPRNSVQSVVDSIVSWCDKAAAVLPDIRPTAEYGKATKLSAMALKARILLYAASPLYNPQTDVLAGTDARFGDGRDSVLRYPTYSKDRWKLAADAAKAVIDAAPAGGIALYTSNPKVSTGETSATIGNYEYVWNTYGNSEIILSQNQGVAPTNSWGDGNIWILYTMSKVGLFSWGIKNNVPIEFMQLYEKNDGTKWTFQSTGSDLPVYVQSLNLDPRFYQTISYDGMQWTASRGKLDYYLKSADGTVAEGRLCSSDAGPNGYAFETYKYVPRIDGATQNHFTWPVFRLAEFYLSYAEALNEFNGGPTTDAFFYMNELRKRVGMPDKTTTDCPDQATFRNTIQNERTIELAYENHRYNDLLRWVKADQALNQTLHGVQTQALKVSGVVTRPWKTVTFIQRVFPKKYYYVPFMNAEIAKNYLGGGKGWKGQNPGW